MAQRTDPREDKLPAWARDIILCLRQDNARLTRDLERRNQGFDGRVIQQNYGRGPDVFYDSQRPVRFKVGNDREDFIEVTLDKDRIEVRGMRIVNVYPSAANTLSVGIRKD